MNRKGMAIVALVLIILFLLFGPQRSSFGTSAQGVNGFNLSNSEETSKLTAAPVDSSMFSGNIGDSVSSASLIPRDVVATEDFGQFSPDKVLGSQSYLDPRSQIGYPETLGGVLRNANHDIRSEPQNPRDPVSIFNLSTIPPDVMRPKFEMEYEYN